MPMKINRWKEVSGQPLVLDSSIVDGWMSGLTQDVGYAEYLIETCKKPRFKTMGYDHKHKGKSYQSRAMFNDTEYSLFLAYTEKETETEFDNIVNVIGFGNSERMLSEVLSDLWREFDLTDYEFSDGKHEHFIRFSDMAVHKIALKYLTRVSDLLNVTIKLNESEALGKS